jgi:hypothetical protein
VSSVAASMGALKAERITTSTKVISMSANRVVHASRTGAVPSQCPILAVLVFEAGLVVEAGAVSAFGAALSIVSCSCCRFYWRLKRTGTVAGARLHGRDFSYPFQI